MTGAARYPVSLNGVRAIRILTLLTFIVTSISACASFDPIPPEDLDFLERSMTQEKNNIRVTVSVPTRVESRKAFGKKLDKLEIQPVWIEIENNSGRDYLLIFHSLDSDYFSAGEAAYASHGLDTAQNKGIDEYFEDLAIERAALAGTTVSGFAFSNLKLGTKEVRIRIYTEGEVLDFEFYVTVPGLRADWQRVEFESLYPENERIDMDDPADLRKYLEEFMCCTTKKNGTGSGDPINLIVIGRGNHLNGFIKAGWDETEIISAGSSWRTTKAFLTGSEYKYSPISALYVFERPQDIGLQKARDTINERNHLRLWLSPVRFRGELVWIGAISRDIGVFFTTRAWNLTTHAIDPEVDEARDYLVEDIATAQALAEFGWIGGVGEVTRDLPKKNLLGSPWWTDGQRTVLWMTDQPTALQDVEIMDWTESRMPRKQSTAAGTAP